MLRNYNIAILKIRVRIYFFFLGEKSGVFSRREVEFCYFYLQFYLYCLHKQNLRVKKRQQMVNNAMPFGKYFDYLFDIQLFN